MASRQISSRTSRAVLSVGDLSLALLFLVFLTVALTWPQTRFLSSRLAAHSDAYFGTWRLAWIGHALFEGHVTTLFDANIFYPEPRTLAYSDAALLQGLVAAPFLRAGVHPVLLYNVLLLFGLFASAAAMFWLCLTLTRSVGASLIAATIFGFAPYRFEHFMHLELQWSMFIPLSMLSLHAAMDRPRFRSACITGLCIGLQFLSCIYYGMFLLPIVSLMTIAEAVAQSVKWRTCVVIFGIVAATAAVIMIPYALPYRANASVLGERQLSDIRQYSASLSSYLAAPKENWLYGWTSSRFGSNEARLFPGLAGLILAGAAVLSGARRYVWCYIVMTVVSVELSLGMNGFVYPVLHAYVTPFRGLRVPARFAICALCGISVLAAIGAEYVLRKVPRAGFRMVACAALLLIAVAECVSVPVSLTNVATSTPPVYRFVRSLGPGVVFEFPSPKADGLPGHDPEYMYWSATHWNKLLNGYSGYYPAGYLRVLEIMARFPDAESLARLKGEHVKYLLLHKGLYPDGYLYDADVETLSHRDDVRALGEFQDWVTDSAVFEVQ